MSIVNTKYLHIFDTSHIQRNVKKKSVNAGFANFFSQIFNFGLTIIRSAVLARLLSPEDYGLFGMLMFVVSFALIFKDLGLGTATIRAKEINHAQVSNLFWINALIGLISMLFVIAISPLIAWFYKDARLFNIGIVISLAFLFSGLSIQHEALLKRQMKFGKISIISVTSAVMSSLIGIIIAYRGNKHWALVWMNVTLNIFLCIGYWLSTEWRPSLPQKNTGTKKLINFGLDVASLNAFSTITMNLDKIIVGKIASAATLGLYTKGNQVPDMVTGQIRMALFSIALPALSSLQNDLYSFKKYFYKFVTFISWGTMPLAVFCMIFADDIIHIYFGRHWADSATFMKIFAIKCFFMPVMTTLDQVPLSLGNSKRYLFSGILRSITSTIFVLSGAIMYGVKGAAFGVAMVDIAVFLPFFKICTKKSGIQLSGYFYSILIPASISLLTGGFFKLIQVSFKFTGIWPSLFAIVLYFFAIVSLFAFCDYFEIGQQIGITRKAISTLKRKR